MHTLKDKDRFDPGSTEFAILLVIYLPRRGLLEIWSPEQKFRIAHFQGEVSKNIIKKLNWKKFKKKI